MKDRSKGNVSRRDFVGALTAAAAAVGFAGSPRAGESMKDLPIGLQLYTVREQCQTDFKGTLERVVNIGYRHFEFAGYGDMKAPKMAAFLKKIGADACGSHVAFEQSEQDPETMIRYCREIGVPYVVAPSMPEDIRGGRRDQIIDFANELNGLGRQVKDAGMQLCYHNHWFEFEEVDGKTIYEILFTAADPDLVKAEMDIAWVFKAKVDPVALMDRWGDRVRLLHMKDLDAEGQLAPVGAGLIDMAAVVAKAKQIGIDWYIVEQDRPREGKDIFDEITLSYRNMVRLLS